MVTNTKTNVKLSDDLIQTNDTFQVLDYVHLLEQVPKVKGKYFCPHCNKNDFSFNKKGEFSCFSGGCKPNEIVKALKLKAGDWIEKNSNNSFTSDYTTNKHSKQAVTVDNTTVKVLKKVKEARPKGSKFLNFSHDVINSPFQVCLKVLYRNHEKVKNSIRQTAINFDVELEITLEQAGIETKDVLPYYELGYNYLVNDRKPEITLITEGQYTARECFNKFDGLLPAISVYGGSSFDIPALVKHLQMNPALKTPVLSPDFELGSFKKFLALSKELKKAGYSVKWLLPYPDSYWDRLNNLPDGHEAVDMFDYINEFSHLTAQEIIDQIKVISDDELERMLTGKTVTVSSVASYAVPISQYLNSENTGVKWLVPGLIQEGVSNMIVAYSNVGKSTLCSQLAIALTQGDNFLGHELAGDKKVLYHTSDESISDLAERVKSQGYIDTNDNFKVFNEIDGVIWDVTNLDSLDYELTHNDYDVVIVDSLSSICASAGINENGPEIGQKLTELIKLVCNKHGKTLIPVHHANRGVLNTNRLNIGNVCGHNSIARPLNQIIALKENTTEDGQNVIDLLTVKARSSSKTELRLVRDDEGKFQVIESISTPTVSTAETDNSNEKLIIDCLSQSDDWLTRDAIQGHTKLSKGFCNKLLLNLTNTGKVERAKVGKGYQYKINSNSIGSKDSDVYTKQEPEPEPIAENLDNSTSQILPLTGSETLEPIEEPIEEPVNNTIDVQSEVIENFPTSDKQDIGQDTKIVNGKVFKTGDIYYQFKNNNSLIQIDNFPDGCDYAKCYKVTIDSTGNVSRDSDSPGFILWLDKEVYPFNGCQLSLLA